MRPWSGLAPPRPFQAAAQVVNRRLRERQIKPVHCHRRDPNPMKNFDTRSLETMLQKRAAAKNHRPNSMRRRQNGSPARNPHLET